MANQQTQAIPNNGPSVLYTEEDWYNLVDTEEGEILTSHIMEEILQKTQDVIFERHIESQVLPYCVQFTKDTLLGMIEWEFFQHDQGEIEALLLSTDKELPPIPLDSWARGAIPTKRRQWNPPHSNKANNMIMSQTELTDSSATSTSNVQLMVPDPLMTPNTSMLLLTQERHPQTTSDSQPTLTPDSSQISSVNDLVSTGPGYPEVTIHVSQHESDTIESSLVRKDSISGAPLSQTPSQSQSELKKKTLSKTGLQHISSKSLAPLSARNHYSRSSFTGSSFPISPRRTSFIHKHAEERRVNPMAMAEKAIAEENKKTLTRLQNSEKEGARPDVGYDVDGRMILVKKPQNKHSISQGIKVRVSSREDATKKGLISPDAVSTAKRTANLTTASTRQPTTSMYTSHKTKPVKKAPTTEYIVPSKSTAQDTAVQEADFIEDPSLDIPALSDTIQLHTGVVLREGEVLRKPSKRKDLPALNKNSLPTKSTPQTVLTSKFKPAPPIPSGLDANERTTTPVHLLHTVLSKAHPTIKAAPFPSKSSDLEGLQKPPLPEIQDVTSENRRESIAKAI